MIGGIVEGTEHYILADQDIVNAEQCTLRCRKAFMPRHLRIHADNATAEHKGVAPMPAGNLPLHRVISF